jgi:CRP/FNR family cyclic AMP-dependent transcriptional regulator
MTTIAAPEVLAKVPLLAGCDRRTLGQLAKELKDRSFNAGQQALVEGESGVGFFIVLEGAASVTVAGQEVRRLGPGDYFGEIALLAADTVRTATVTAVTDLRCVGLTEWEFRPFLAEHPDVAWQVMSTMARRIAESPQT